VTLDTQSWTRTYTHMVLYHVLFGPSNWGELLLWGWLRVHLFTLLLLAKINLNSYEYKNKAW